MVTKYDAYKELNCAWEIMRLELVIAMTLAKKLRNSWFW